MSGIIPLCMFPTNPNKSHMCYTASAFSESWHVCSTEVTTGALIYYCHTHLKCSLGWLLSLHLARLKITFNNNHEETVHCWVLIDMVGHGWDKKNDALLTMLVTVEGPLMSNEIEFVSIMLNCS